MFEHRSQPLLDRRAFVRRQWRYVLAALGFVAISLAAGTVGYVHFAGQPTVDAFLNASMILAGMGPIGDLPDTSAKIFASIYALYCGIGLLTTVAMVLAPALHRLLHALHLEEGSGSRRLD